MMRSATAWRVSVIGFAIASALLVDVGWITFRRMADLREATALVQHTLLVRADADGILSLVKDAETGQRGFVITGSAAFLEPYEAALTQFSPRLDQLRRLTADNPTQQANLATLDGLIRQKLAEMRESVATRQRDGFEAAARGVDAGTGRRVMDEARLVVAAIDAEEARLLAGRQAAEDQEAGYAIATSLGGLAAAIVLLAGAALLMGTAIRQRERERTRRATAEAITAAVRQSEERLRVTIASIGDAVVTTDEQGHVVGLNAVAETLTGWTEADAVGRPLDEVFVIINEESRRPAENPVHKVLRDGVIAGLANHTVLISRDGRNIPIDDSAAPIRTADGRMAGVVMVFRDITERRQVERERNVLLEHERAARNEAERTRIAAETAERQLRLALESSHMGTWEFILGSGTMNWSAGLEAIYGYAPGTFPGTFEAYRDKLHPDDRDRVLRDIAEAAEGRPHHIEYRIVRTDGTVRWVERRGELFLDAGERPERMVGICTDITERKQSEERFQLVVEAAPAAMIAVDARGTIVLVNALTEQLLGYLRTELIGQSIERLVPLRFRGQHPEYRTGFFTNLQRRPMGMGRDLYAVRKDGSEIPVEIGLSPFETTDGVFVLAAVTDITERKRSEDRERLARREAERANRLKDEFLAMVSHELRTPLNAILGWADMLQSGTLQDARRDRAIHAIHSNAQRQAQLIGELLDVSRIMSGKLLLGRTAVDLQNAVRTAIEVVQASADAKGIHIAVDADPSVGPFYADATRLQQILWNLLSNAIKFTPDGGAVHVRVWRADGGVELIVTDTGQGIPAAFLPSVFEPFQQADRSTARQHGGLGLGLSIVRHLVEAHGGTITVESAGEGQGSTFILRLPIVAVYADRLDAGPTTQPSPSNPSATDASASLDGLTVLVVDDDEESRELVAATLESRGALVLPAASAADALRVLSSQRVDVLLSDVAMPGEDGYSLIRRVRLLEMAGAPFIPAAALTSFARDEDRQQALQAGFQLHLVKPIDSRALVEAVASLTRIELH